VIPPKRQCSQLYKTSEAKIEAILAIYPNVEVFAIENNLYGCIKKYSCYKTSLDALLSGKAKLSELAAVYSERSLVGWIKVWLISLSQLMDFEISIEQAELTAIALLEDNYMFNIVEFTLFFSRIRKGHYGIFYGKFNMQTILIAAKDYRKERGKEYVRLPTAVQKRLI
jgi:hypothetical protein